MNIPAALLEVINKELVPRDPANEESEDCAMGGIDTEEAIAGAIAGDNRPVVVTGWPVVPRPEGIARKPLASSRTLQKHRHIGQKRSGNVANSRLRILLVMPLKFLRLMLLLFL
jgi:hypothetical protein